MYGKIKYWLEEELIQILRICYPEAIPRKITSESTREIILMTRVNTPINLTKYEVITDDVSTQQVDAELRSLMGVFATNQQAYYDTSFEQLARSLMSDNVPVKGSLNSLGRKLGITASHSPVYQQYNFHEMFRASMLMKMGGYLQSNIIISIINNLDTPDVRKVLEVFKKEYGVFSQPTHSFVKRTIESLLNKGVIHNTPTSDGVVPFWASDTHYSKVTRDKNSVYFTVKLANIKQVTLRFTLPDSERFKGDKVTRPNVYLDRKGNVRFGFTVQKNVPLTLKTANTVGVDIGVVQPFTATAMTPEVYSPPYHPNKRINTISKKITSLSTLTDKLWVKEQLNTHTNHPHKALILNTERKRVRGKISRLKLERSHHIANQLVQIALHYNATIILEELSWTPNSKWEKSIIQTSITDKAATRGVRVKKINPKNTSQSCSSSCGKKVKHSGRSTKCVSCAKVLDRDILASRNIARKDSKGFENSFKQLSSVKSLRTRVTNPVTPGEPTNYVNPLTRITT